MVLAVAKAIEAGATGIICASTGNTSASAAAFAAQAGLECVVVLPAGQIAAGKLLQALVAGAHVVAIDGNFDQALEIVRVLAEGKGVGAAHPLTLVNSVNPVRIEGQKTAAFEVCDDLGRAPDVLAIPVGNAGNITAYWAGFRAYADAGLIAALPRMCGFQAAGAAPIVLGHVVERPDTVATAIRIGNPASWSRAVAARDESGGVIEAVSDDEILGAYRAVARLEGVFCEPSSAASLAGVRRLAAEGRITPDELVVCVLTGNGLKDPDTALRGAPPVLETEPTVDAVIEALGW
jgi:threonine synthase